MHRTALSPDPFTQFAAWFRAAEDAGLQPHAMALATATPDGLPSARMVLLKDYDTQGFTFFTNYESQKGRELAQNPHAALVFYWASQNRQIRLTGTVAKLTQAESDAYFQSRPRGSQIATWVSRQGTVIENRTILEARYEEFVAQFGDTLIPRPRYWGGYRLTPNTFEFWQSGEHRLHDRFHYIREGDGWQIKRLAP